MVKLWRHVGLVVILSMVSLSFGDVLALTDLYGVVQERYTYTAAGKSDIYDAAGTTLRTTSTPGNPYMFTSRRWDAKTGNYYFRARFQRPSVAGQFLNRDPLEYSICWRSRLSASPAMIAINEIQWVFIAKGYCKILKLSIGIVYVIP